MSHLGILIREVQAWGRVWLEGAWCPGAGTAVSALTWPMGTDLLPLGCHWRYQAHCQPCPTPPCSACSACSFTASFALPGALGAGSPNAGSLQEVLWGDLWRGAPSWGLWHALPGCSCELELPPGSGLLCFTPCSRGTAGGRLGVNEPVSSSTLKFGSHNPAQQSCER